MDKELFLANLREAVEIEDSYELEEDTLFKEHENWSSIASLMTTAMIFSEYDVQITGDELESCNTIKELYILIKNKIGA
jgi:acyl carrier protein